VDLSGFKDVIFLDTPSDCNLLSLAGRTVLVNKEICGYQAFETIDTSREYMLQIFAIFYLPGLLNLFVWPRMNTGWVWFDQTISTRFIAALVAFGINYAAYFSVIFRGGIENISIGQSEAGYVLGMTKRQIFFKVILLQVIKHIIPPMSNEIITLIKDTSLANTISVYELIFYSKKFMLDGMIWPIFYAGAFYLLFVGLLTIIFGKIEKKLGYFRA
jgi:polar amino acid transport system permease protein